MEGRDRRMGKILCEHNGRKYFICKDNISLAEKHHVSQHVVEKYGALFIIITEGETDSRQLEQYPCVYLPENMSRYGFTNDEVQQIILHELGHAYVPGAIDRELKHSSVEKEMLADTYTTRADVMISALKKIRKLLVQYIAAYPVSPLALQQATEQFDLRIAALKKRLPRC